MALIQKVLESEISRRSFLKGSAAAIGAASAALTVSSPIAYANELETAAASAEEGKWVAAPCPHNCGGKCLVKAYVKDGVILRQKTDDF
ncbi:MAG: twin-arginine translocation signal domain-containing protein, partial [Clostridia bacterium]|nr:twin-arginine translocation signal domain-containing protein [Clostridia bacterium]